MINNLLYFNNIQKKARLELWLQANVRKTLNHTATTSSPNFPHLTNLSAIVQQKTFLGGSSCICTEIGLGGGLGLKTFTFIFSFSFCLSFMHEFLDLF
jgi:hypothetical protein